MKRKTSLVIFAFSILFILFCSSDIPENKNELITYLNELGSEYEKICIEMGEANWNVYSKEGEADQNAPKLKYSELLLNPDHLKIINTWIKKIDKNESPRLYRRLKVWKNVLTAAKVDMDPQIFRLENELESAITDYTHNIDGENVSHLYLRQFVSRKYKNPLDREKKIIECYKTMQEELEPKVLKLMRLRNNKSLKAGFKNYGELCLYMMGLISEDEKWFYNLIEKIDNKTLKPYENLIKNGLKRLNLAEVNESNIKLIVNSQINNLPRHRGYNPANAFDIAKQTILNIGFDLNNLPIRIVEKDIPYAGLGLAIKIPSDHRILVLPDRGNVGLYLHEIGHGLQAVHTQRTEPIFKGYEWCLGANTPCYQEGMANVAARFSNNDKWQIKYNHKSPERLKKEEENRKIIAPFLIRSQINNFMFELKLYENLDKDPQITAKELFEKWMLVKPDSDIRKYWATDIFPVAYPCYRQNYFISDIISWQVHKHLQKKYGETYIYNNNVSTWLKENLYSLNFDTLN